MSDEQRPPDEEEQVNEAPVVDDAPAEEKPKKKAATHAVEDDEDDEYEPLTVAQLRGEVKEIGTRARNAGLNPLRQMARAYLDNALDAIDGLLSALEGSKKRKGD